MLVQMSNDFWSRDVLEITDPEQARLLLSDRTLCFLAPFVGQARPAAGAAKVLGVRLSTLLYQLGQLQAAGLLQVVREVPRAGRPVRWYRASGDAYFIPYWVSPFATPREWLRCEFAPKWERLIGGVVAAGEEMLGTDGTADVLGLEVVRAADGRLVVQHRLHSRGAARMDPTAPTAPAVLTLWGDPVALDFEDAKNLQREMAELFARYGHKDGTGAYVVMMAMAPRVSSGSS